MPEDENLKLACDFFFGKIFGRTKMTAAGVVDQHVKITGFGECGAEGIFD